MKILRRFSLILISAILCALMASCEISGGAGGDSGVGDGASAPITYLSIEGDSEREMIDGPGSTITLSLNISGEAARDVVWSVSGDAVSCEGGVVVALREGVAYVTAELGPLSDSVKITVTAGALDDGGTGSGSGGNTDGGTEDDGGFLIPDKDDPITSDPYEDITKEEFYSSYTPAVSYMDAYYRTQHNLLSGILEVPDAAPTVAENRPTKSGKLLKNAGMYYSSDGNTYYVLNAEGELELEIYRGAAYITLEEIAAHMYAFGELPANHSSKKSAKPTNSPWGEYLRCNHSYFSGDTDRYPYEPKLPDISGLGGSMQYYEMDIGTTGTDTGTGHSVSIYNDGKKIVRGAARIVYAREDKNGDGDYLDIGEIYLFYTYNHYNDFREYLNYYGGWGEMFGNITGGGALSSETNYNPTPYVQVEYGYIASAREAAFVVILALPPKIWE